jgi:two-component system chemotaxis response regulator CheB
LTTTTLRVLVVDDSIVHRKLVGEALASFSGVEVVGTATNGKVALARIAEWKPDAVTLDVEMPEMDGIEVLERIREQYVDVEVVMVSSHTLHGSALTIRALELGAFDFVPKPDQGNVVDNRRALQDAFGPILGALAHRRTIKSILRTGSSDSHSHAALRGPADRSATKTAPRCDALPAELILIGVSTGGPNALSRVLPRLPADLGVPVLVVQHMPPIFTRSLAVSLDARCPLTVKEAEDGEPLLAGTVYLAPGGLHMKLGGASARRTIQVTNDPPENNCRPSADVLFRSAAHTVGAKACAVIMTGMGADGALGLRLLKRAGGRVIAQDAASCVVFGMPKAAIDAGVVDVVVPLDAIAEEIGRAVRGQYT